LTDGVSNGELRPSGEPSLPGVEEWRRLPHAEILRRGAESLGMALSDDRIGVCLRCLDLLLDWNRKVNLTAIRDPEDALVKHFLDSMAAASLLPEKRDARLADVGTGAGFPGVALKIVRPDLKLLLLDSGKKRLDFLEAVVRELGLRDAETLHARAEDAGRDPAYREKFDVVTARAVADLRTLAELCLPLTKPGGRFLALKGPQGEAEHREAQSAIAKLGGKLREARALTLPFLNESRLILAYEKVRPTPSRYPRPFAEIRRNPLT
jgi:16S rRNA (guanine527-N7)-methyltransferase